MMITSEIFHPVKARCRSPIPLGRCSGSRVCTEAIRHSPDGLDGPNRPRTAPNTPAIGNRDPIETATAVCTVTEGTPGAYLKTRTAKCPAGLDRHPYRPTGAPSGAQRPVSHRHASRSNFADRGWRSFVAASTAAYGLQVRRPVGSRKGSTTPEVKWRFLMRPDVMIIRPTGPLPPEIVGRLRPVDRPPTAGRRGEP